MAVFGEEVGLTVIGTEVGFPAVYGFLEGFAELGFEEDGLDVGPLVGFSGTGAFVNPVEGVGPLVG